MLFLNLTDTMSSHKGGYRINTNWVSPRAGVFLYLSFFPLNATAVAASSRGKIHIHQFADGESDREWQNCTPDWVGRAEPSHGWPLADPVLCFAVRTYLLARLGPRQDWNSVGRLLPGDCVALAFTFAWTARPSPDPHAPLPRRPTLQQGLDWYSGADLVITFLSLVDGSAQISVCLKGRGQCCGVCPPPPPPQQCTTVADTHYWGGGIASVKADSPGGCCAACGANADCRAWCEAGGWPAWLPPSPWPRWPAAHATLPPPS